MIRNHTVKLLLKTLPLLTGSFMISTRVVKDYWLRFEWQHRGSPHIHGLAWPSNAPDVENIFSDPNVSDEDKQLVLNFIDSLVSTQNPALPQNNPDISQAQNFEQIRIYVTNHFVKPRRISLKTSFSSLPHVKGTLCVQKHIASEMVMEDKCAASVFQNHWNKIVKPISMRMVI